MTASVPALSAPPPVSQAPAAAPLRPRVLLVGAAFASAAAAMLVLSMVGIYLSRRADVINNGLKWLPQGANLQLAQPTMILFTMIIATITLLWAAYSLRQEDRTNSYLALVITLILGFAAVNQATYFLAKSKLPIRTEAGLLIIGISAVWIAWVVVAMGFVALMTFRVIGGQFRRIPDGVSAAAMFWMTSTAVWFVLWVAVFITK